MRIILTAITGNCESDIVRFLDQFQPFFDETIIVRAIGNAQPDKTLQIAQERGCRVAEYRNADHNQWEHVDDFAEARNLALSLANGDWVAWADIDDTVIGLETMRGTLAKVPEEMQIVKCAYILPEQEVTANIRERFFRIGCGKWVNALHENFATFTERKMADGFTDKIKIIHSPSKERLPSNLRNRRILESVPEEKRTLAHDFYLCMEYAREKSPKALELAKRFLANPESGAAERYEIFLTLASIADDYSLKAAYYVQAWQESPDRAEALYELCSLSLACEENKRGLAYAKQMMACDWADKPAWNHRKKFYGFTRLDLYWQALRLNLHVKKSDVLRYNYTEQMQGNNAIISLLHATRGRALQAAKARKLWLDLADKPELIDHRFGIDADDEESVILNRFPCSILDGKGGCVAAWNRLAQESYGEILVQMSDDWQPFQGWDTALRARLDIRKPQVLAVNDGSRKDELLCMAILTRKRLAQVGYLFHPRFKGVFSDNFFTLKAYNDGVLVHANDLIFKHLHPAFGTAEIDATYAKQNSAEAYEEGLAIYNELTANHE